MIPVRVGHDGLAAHFIESDLLRAVPGRGRDGNRRGDALRIGDRPFKRLHSAHRPAGDREQSGNAEMPNQHFLDAHHVGDRNAGKRHGPRTSGFRIDGAGSGGAAAASQNVRADDEIPVGVERLSGTDHALPPAALPAPVRVAGERVADQDRVIFRRVQFAVSFIGDLYGREGRAAIEVDAFERGGGSLGDHDGELSVYSA